MGINYFKDKICTILVSPTNREFSEEQNLKYFVGKLVGADNESLEIENLDGTRSLYFRDKVIGIAEEKIEESYEVIEEKAEEKEESKFLDVNFVKQMALKAKEHLK